jgi:uncharacterized protein YaiE (UPF0345 family)
MATTIEKPREASQATPLEHLPPLHTTTEGIPTREHVTTEPSAAPARERRTWWAWALAGVVGLLLVAVGVFALMPQQATTGLHMGLTPEAWQQYRAGERASIPLAGPMGLTAAAWGDYRAGERATARQASSTMGLTTQAWQEYRAGERATTAPTQMGLTLPAWQEYRAGERAV